MFPLTHVYAIGRLVDTPQAQHILGAIFPDAVLTSGLDWERAHQCGAELYGFLQRCAPECLPFAVGVISHGVIPHGLDYYGDQKYADFERGYCFEEARPYAGRVAQLCHLPSSMGWWKAHNFVEMAFEWLLVQRVPTLGRQIQQTIVDEAGLVRLTPHLGVFFDWQGEDLTRSLPAMLPFLALREVTPDVLAERYQRQVRLKHGVEKIQVGQAAALIEEISEAIQPRCWDFLEDVLSRIAGMLEREGWVG